MATPVDWKHGDKCMVIPALSDEAAKEKLGGFDVVQVPSGKPYIRMTVPTAIFTLNFTVNFRPIPLPNEHLLLSVMPSHVLLKFSDRTCLSTHMSQRTPTTLRLLADLKAIQLDPPFVYASPCGLCHTHV